jgi:mono/diheme cytochrome c family protein
MKNGAGKLRINGFWAAVLTLLVVYGVLKWGVPAISRQITSLPFPLPVPGTLMFMFIVLTVIALFMYVTYSDENLEEFVRPVRRLLAGRYGAAPRIAVLVAVPLVVGWQVYDTTVPKIELPSALRIQHPSSNFPKKFEALKNPAANPTDAQIDAFVAQAKANKVELIPQVMADVDVWMKEADPKHMLEFFPTKPMQTFVTAVKAGGAVDKAAAKAALLEKNLFEGRALYAMNCRPCHGDSVAGDGPMADGFKLRPINFTDNGTIETIVEGYTFWRVTNGGPGLPTEATPWDSAMPEWKLNLTEEERWKIILAEYDLAGKTPRIPESH